MDCHILRLLHVEFNPFRLRAWYRKSKQERRWVELSGEMIQIKISRGKRRVQIPYDLPLRFEHLKEQMGNYKRYPFTGFTHLRKILSQLIRTGIFGTWVVGGEIT